MKGKVAVVLLAVSLVFVSVACEKEKEQDHVVRVSVQATEIPAETESVSVESVVQDKTSEPQTEVDDFVYYDIPEEYEKSGGAFPEDVQRYLWKLCESKDLDYYIVVAMIERESGYKADELGDDGNSKGYMQIYQKYHNQLMQDENVSDLFEPYGNLRIGTSILQSIYEKYGNSGDHCVLMVYNMGSGGANRLWKHGTYSTEYSRTIVARAEEIKQELTQEK